jgi:hypothetical protein
MRKAGVVWIILPVLGFAAAAEELTGTVTEVISGNIVKVQTADGQKMVGLPGIAFEDKKAAKEFTVAQMLGKTVTVLVERVSPRGPVYGDIRIGEGEVLSALLHKGGFVAKETEEDAAELLIPEDESKVERMVEASRAHARERQAQWDRLSEEERKEILQARQEINLRIQQRRREASARIAQQRAEEQRRLEALLAEQQAAIEQPYLGGEPGYYEGPVDPAAIAEQEAEAARRAYVWEQYGVPLGSSTTTYSGRNRRVSITTPVIPEGAGPYF